MSRTQFGFERTECACEACTINCRFVPGMLVPDDLEPLCIAQRAAPSESPPDYDELLGWAMTHLLASPGALVAKGGELFRIPTLVPARQSDGYACINLTAEGRCAVHQIAPYGCAFMDAHMPYEEGLKRSARALHAIIADVQSNGRYWMLWRELYAAGRTAMPPEKSRQAMQMALASEGPKYVK